MARQRIKRMFVHDTADALRLNAAHAADVKPSWYGDSVGHYEGDTLVVDTIGLNDKTFLDNYRTPLPKSCT
jgi:hypothetical protein